MQAALDAGARYADARVMHRRYESMTARNGEIEDAQPGRGRRHRRARPGRVGLGLLRRTRPLRRAPPARAGAAGRRRSPRPARWCPGRRSTLVPTRRRRPGRGPARATIDPLARRRCPTRATCWSGRPRRCASTAPTWPRALYQIWDTAQVVRLQRGPPHRPAHPRVRRRDHGHRDRRRRDPAPLLPGRPRPVRHPRLGAGRRARPARRTPPRVGRGGPGAADRARCARPARPTLILGGEQLALQIHESVGHAIELDRILGWEAAFAGTSWLDLAQLGSLRYGSELMNITIDPTIPGALGSLRLRRRGHARRPPRDAVRDGIWVGVLAGRDSAAVAGLDYARQRARRRLGPAADGADDQRRARARAAHARRDHRRHRRRDLHGDQPLLVDRRPAAELPVRHARSATRSRTASSAGCCATRRTPASARSSGRRWTCCRRRSSRGARRTAARASPARSATPAIRRRRPGSATSAWGCGHERRARTSPARAVELVAPARRPGRRGRGVGRSRTGWR